MALTGCGASSSPASPSAARAAPEPFARFTTVVAIVTDAAGNERELCLLLADESELRARGLMGVADLAGFDGMAFEFDELVRSAFVMVGTRLALSIAWYADGAYVGATDMDLCREGGGVDRPCRRHVAPAPFDLAIEVPRGALDELGLVAGSTVALARDRGCTP